MTKRKLIQISGHINAATCDHIKNILSNHNIDIDIDAIPISTSESFGLEEMIISLAGAIAAIISCIGTMMQLRDQRKHRKQKEHEKEIDKALKNIGDGTYERIGNIQTFDNISLEEAESFTVTLRDVPAARIIIVKVKSLQQIIVIDSSELNI